MTKFWIGACLCVGLVAGYGCDDENNPVEAIDESIDCAAICDKYQECFDTDYDVDECEASCDARADDPDHLDQEQVCSDCIDDLSCGDATFSCTDDCVGIVP
jgi:hypothetical protein